MEYLLQVEAHERAQYFQQAAAQSSHIQNSIILEKDFWVCWVLQQIFSHPVLASQVTFKGGTSLSKCYQLIARFSEDIDLTLAKSFIGIDHTNDPARAESIKQRNKRLAALSVRVEQCVTQTIKPLLQTCFHQVLSKYFNASDWRIVSDMHDKQTLLFHYPRANDHHVHGYIQSAIKLEFGARSDMNPCTTETITPYVQQLLPALFDTPVEIPVSTLLAKRTFWEKITLLHAEYHRDPTKPLPGRMFRHYYDIVMLHEKGVSVTALNDKALLDDVLRNKMTYFPSKWAHYETAQIGKLRVYPHPFFIDQLKDDYRRMTEMFFGEAPGFEHTLEVIKNVEATLNGKFYNT